MARGAREERVEPQDVVDVASDVENIAHQVNGNRQAANNSGPREHSSLAPSAKHEKEAFEESMAAHEAHILNTQRAGTNFCRGKLLLKYDSISLERSFLKQKIMERIPVFRLTLAFLFLTYVAAELISLTRGVGTFVDREFDESARIVKRVFAFVTAVLVAVIFGFSFRLRTIAADRNFAVMDVLLKIAMIVLILAIFPLGIPGFLSEIPCRGAEIVYNLQFGALTVPLENFTAAGGNVSQKTAFVLAPLWAQCAAQAEVLDTFEYSLRARNEAVAAFIALFHAVYMIFVNLVLSTSFVVPTVLSALYTFYSIILVSTIFSPRSFGPMTGIILIIIALFVITVTINVLKEKKDRYVHRLEAVRKSAAELALLARMAEQKREEKQKFIATVSHEIRTPIHGILGITDLILEGNLSSELKDRMMVVRSCGASLLNLVNDILDQSKLHNQGIVLANAPFNARTLLEKCIESIAFQCQSKGLELSLGLGPVLLYCSQKREVVGDDQRINQVITNLISNAKKFTRKGNVFVSAELFRSTTGSTFFQREAIPTSFDSPTSVASPQLENNHPKFDSSSPLEEECELDGGQLLLKTQERLDLMSLPTSWDHDVPAASTLLDDNDVVLAVAVRDEGVGISEEDQERIFHMFEQIKTKETEHVAGTGLGLAISRTLCELMGGKIYVKSTPGKGSVFTSTMVLHWHPTERSSEGDDSLVGVTRVTKSEGEIVPQRTSHDYANDKDSPPKKRSYSHGRILSQIEEKGRSFTKTRGALLHSVEECNEKLHGMRGIGDVINGRNDSSSRKKLTVSSVHLSEGRPSGSYRLSPEMRDAQSLVPKISNQEVLLVAVSNNDYVTGPVRLFSNMLHVNIRICSTVAELSDFVANIPSSYQSIIVLWDVDSDGLTASEAKVLKRQHTDLIKEHCKMFTAAAGRKIAKVSIGMLTRLTLSTSVVNRLLGDMVFVVRKPLLYSSFVELFAEYQTPSNRSLRNPSAPAQRTQSITMLLSPAEEHVDARSTTSSIYGTTKGREKQILIADDDYLSRQLLEKMIRRCKFLAGYTVVAFQDGDELLDHIGLMHTQTGSGPPSPPSESGASTEEPMAARDTALVFVDIHMPHIGGLEVIRRIRYRRITVPIVIVSAEERRGATERPEGATAVLTKPFSQRDLDTLVASLEKDLRERFQDDTKGDRDLPETKNHFESKESSGRCRKERREDGEKTIVRASACRDSGESRGVLVGDYPERGPQWSGHSEDQIELSAPGRRRSRKTL